MDPHVSLRSVSEEEEEKENLDKEASANEIQLRIHDDNDDDASAGGGGGGGSKIGNLVSPAQSTTIQKTATDKSTINGHSPVTQIQDLGSTDEAANIDFLLGSVLDHGQIRAHKNGSSGVHDILKIDVSVEEEEEEEEEEKAVTLASKCVGSPTASMEKPTDDHFKSGTRTRTRTSGSSMDAVGGSGSSPAQLTTLSPAKTRGQGIEIEKVVESPSKDSPSTTKGYGLKKWRRIKRDPGKDGGGAADQNRILKRGLSITEPVKSRDPSGDNRQKSEGSSGSVALANSTMKNMVFSASPIGGSDSESRLAVEIAFPAGTDSENSEDRSSKSTAASAPKLRLEMPLGAGSTKEKGKGKNPSGRLSACSTHKAQQGKGKIETSKKLRGERVRAEKENSHSSVESDLRSSSAAFMLASGFSGAGDGRRTERLLNYTGENSDEVHVSDPQSSEEVQADYCKENGEEIEVVSIDASADISDKENKKERQNHNPSMDQDPLIESIVLLQTVQTALEKEVKEFGEIGKESISALNGFSHGAGASEHVLFEEREESDSPPSEPQMIKLTHKVNHLEHKLAVTSVALKAKESEVLALESILNKIQLPGCIQDQTVLQEQEVELDSLFKRRIEAEVEYLIMTRTTQKLKVTAEDQISLYEDQKSLVVEQEEMLLKLKEAENRATMLRMQTDELEASCKKLLETTEILRMQSDVCKNSLRFVIQLVLLCIVFALFLLQLLPHSTGFVPT
ncbi:hypothetical protein ACLOJK_015350 [Asimina triloba]